MKKRIVSAIALGLFLVHGDAISQCIQGDCQNDTGVYIHDDGRRYEGMVKQ